MTDNRTTELLCRLLEERGVEWWDSRYGEQVVFQVGDVKWFANDGCRDGMVELSTILITPEQAIAATLGSGTCEIALARLVDVAAKVDIDSCAKILECVEAIRKAVKR